jgi:hypothetical protein
MERLHGSIAPALKATLLNNLGFFWGQMVYWAICLVVAAGVLYATAVALLTAWQFPAGIGN